MNRPCWLRVRVDWPPAHLRFCSLRNARLRRTRSLPSRSLVGDVDFEAMKSTGDEIDTRLRDKQHAMAGEEGRAFLLGGGNRKDACTVLTGAAAWSDTAPHPHASLGALVVF